MDTFGTLPQLSYGHVRSMYKILRWTWPDAQYTARSHNEGGWDEELW